VLKLEGQVGGRRVTRTCESADAVTTAAARLLDGCGMHELRMLRILKTLHTAAIDGRTWGWSAAEFALTMHGRQDGGD
jgi:hypothetical protein